MLKYRRAERRVKKMNEKGEKGAMKLGRGMESRTRHRESVRTRISRGGLAAALIASVAVFAGMLRVESKVLSDYEKGTVFAVRREIPGGQLINGENYREYFEEILLEKNVIPPTAICTVDQVTGLVAEADIEKGVILTEGMFESMNEITADMEEAVIVGLRAEDLYQMVGGTLRPGDRVHIYRVEEDGLARLVWEDVYVHSVFDQSGKTVGNEDGTTAVQRINVYMDKENVEKFYAELSAERIRIAKVEK